MFLANEMVSKSGNQSHSWIVLRGRKMASIEIKTEELIESTINELGY